MKAKFLGVAGASAVLVTVCSVTLIALCVLTGFSYTAQAATVFTYTGNSFDAFSGDDVCPQQCNLAGSFTVAGPLTDYLGGPAWSPGVIVISNPDPFAFTDGLNTITSQTIGTGNGVGAVFVFVINAAGQPDFSKGWIAVISWNDSTVNVPLNYLSSISQGTGGIGTYGTLDQSYHFVPEVPPCNYSCGLQLAGNASIANDPGVWTVATTIPEPATWAMVLLGFAGLGLAGYPRGFAAK